jgi:hypothetical protein
MFNQALWAAITEEKTGKKGSLKARAPHKEFHENDHNDAFIEEVLLKPTKYDLILSVIEATNFGMPPIAQYHLIGYMSVNSYIVKESVILYMMTFNKFRRSRREISIVKYIYAILLYTI